MCLTTFRITYSCDYRSAQFINCWRIFTSLFFEVSTHRKSEISVAKVVFVNEWVCVRVSHLFVRSIFSFNVHGVIHWLVVTRSLALSMLFILISTSVFIIHSVFFCLFFSLPVHCFENPKQFSLSVFFLRFRHILPSTSSSRFFVSLAFVPIFSFFSSLFYFSQILSSDFVAGGLLCWFCHATALAFSTRLCEYKCVPLTVLSNLS